MQQRYARDVGCWEWMPKDLQKSNKTKGSDKRNSWLLRDEHVHDDHDFIKCEHVYKNNKKCRGKLENTVT